MQTRFLLAVLSALFGSFVSLLDKRVLKERVEPVAFSSFRIITNALMMLLLASPLLFNQPIRFDLAVLALSMILSINAILYFSALKIGDISKLIPFRFWVRDSAGAEHLIQ